MATVCGGVYSFLKDRHTPVVDRLKLARYVWLSEKVYLPNKQQIIIDIITGLLANKKRLKLSEDEVSQVWECLYEILQTYVYKSDSLPHSGNTVVIKSSFCQTVGEFLQSHGPESDQFVTLKSVLGCCQFVLNSPMLNYVFTCKFDNLVQLYSQVLTVACHLHKKKSGLIRDALDLLSSLIGHFARAVNSSANQKHVFQTTVVKTLIPVTVLLFHLSQEPDKCQPVLQRLQDVLSKSLLCQDHREMYMSYLMSEQSKSAPPKYMEQLFSLFKSAISGGAKFQALPPEVIQTAVVQYLPQYFSSFVSDINQKKSCKLKLLMWLCDQLTGQLTRHVTSDSRKDLFISCVGGLLKVVQKFDLYNVAEDNTSDMPQLQFYRKLLESLVQERPSLPVVGCLDTLLGLNHAILEPKLKIVLQQCWFIGAETNTDLQNKCDEFLVKMLNIYVQLRQLPRWVGKVLSQLETADDISRQVQMYQQLLDRFGSHAQSIPPGPMLEIWSQFTKSVSDVFLTSLKQGEEKVPNFCLMVQLMNTFLQNVRIVDSGITAVMADKVKDQLTSIKGVVTELASLTRAEQDFDLIYAVLVLCYSWGELSLLIDVTGNCNNNNHLSLDLSSHESSSPLDLSLVHPYLSSKQWRLLSQRINSSGSVKCQYMLQMLRLQKLRMLSFSEAENVGVQNLLETLLTVTCEPHGRERCSHVVWNSQVQSLTRNTLPVAHWKLLANYLPLVIPLLSDDQRDKLASYIIQTALSHEDITADTGTYLTVSSISLEILRSAYVHEQSDLLSAMMTSLWRNVHTHLSDVQSRSKKRKVDKGQILVYQVYEMLYRSDDKINWRLLSDSHDSVVEDHLSTVSSCLTDLLSLATPVQTRLDDSFIKYTKVLSHLPLIYLSPGEKVRCLSGLFTLLVTSTTNRPAITTGQSLHSLAMPTTHLISVILDSQSKSPFFHFIGTETLIGWCEKFVKWIISQETKSSTLRDKSMLMVDLIIRHLLWDFKLLRNLQASIDKIVERLQATWLTEEEGLLTVVSSMLVEMSKMLCRPRLKADYQQICYTCMEKLAAPCVQLIDQLTASVTNVSVQKMMFSSYTALLRVVLQSQHTDYALTDRVKSVLWPVLESKFEKMVDQSLLLILENKVSNLSSALQFVSTACQIDSHLSKHIGGSQKSQLWQSVFELLLKVLKLGDPELSCERLGSEKNSGERNVQTKDDRATTTTISATLAALLASCEPTEFSPLMKSVVQNFMCSFIRSEPWRISAAVLIWDQLLCCNLSEEHMLSFCKAVHDTISQCQPLLEATLWRKECPTDLVVEILKLETRMLEFGEVLMSRETAALSLMGCQYRLLENCPLDMFPVLFSSVYHVLNALLVNHTATALSSVPALVNACKLLMKSLVHQADQRRTDPTGHHQAMSITDLVQCAHQMDRLFTLLSSHKLELGKVAPYLVSNYVSEVQQVTLIPAVKKTLVPAVYKMLEICDKHGIALLHAVLNPGLQEVFRLLYEEYNKNYRYSGRV